MHVRIMLETKDTASNSGGTLYNHDGGDLAVATTKTLSMMGA